MFETNMDGVEVFVDGKSAESSTRARRCDCPACGPASTPFKASMGYEPDGPREETVYPGQSTVSSRS